MLIGFRVDSSKIIGSGHLFRCIKIANYLIKKGHIVHFLVSSISDTFSKNIPKKAKLIRIKSNFGKIEKQIIKNHFKNWNFKMIFSEINFLKKKIKVKYDWIIIDHYSLPCAYHKKIYQITDKLIVIDDLSKKNYCDIYINNQINNNDALKKKIILKKNTKKLLGLNFIVSNYNYRYKLKKKLNKNIFISMGSIDKNNFLLKTIKKILFIFPKRTKFFLYLPTTLKNYASVFKFIIKFKNINIIKKPISLEKLYPRVDLVISAINTTLLEQLKYGYKPFAICQNKNQRNFMRKLLNKNLINFVNFEKKYNNKFKNLILNEKNYFLEEAKYQKIFNVKFNSKLYDLIKLK